MSFGFISAQHFTSDKAAIRSSAPTALVAINYRKDFDSSLKQKFAAIYSKAVDVSYPDATAIVLSAVADSTLGYKDIIKDVAFLQDARKKLSLPEDIESIVLLYQKAHSIILLTGN
jgi:hypothetical protein